MRATAADDTGARWLCVDDGAERVTVDAAIRGALMAQRSRLASVEIDVLSDEDWPPNVRVVVRLAESRLAARRRSGISLSLDPRVAEDFDIALALSPFSIGCTGLSARGTPIWNADDTGSSTAFALTSIEERTVRSAIARAGGDAGKLVTLEAHELRQRELSDGVGGGTTPGRDTWRPPSGWRVDERTVHLGSGTDVWQSASAAVLSWEIKTRSGFSVDPPLEPGRSALPGERYWLVARVGPLRVREPVEVVETIVTHRRVALAYATLEGPPAIGEEAFIVGLDADGAVTLTVRSLTRPGQGRWRALYPLTLLAQRIYRRRYVRALRQPDH
ncbi:uncharacterized protein (UPF0548 family) [Isoptericola sp. CG 20/1183]|uniref:Uncharacterized protein (UPF0548 family) n=1 Tax=Isoptericola halotolerans TaxID=300560 RepID=A0ABX5ECM1_9MICO|nr:MULTISPECIES: DUF1990 domain-containing protein [Isoptericola]PRZ03240.1 uncharacterized protein (UPF0548 family) [Isoptericola sp. CG 20/1183]PRZ03548.1 uncharacterized protein (UPF0548 family) [Isoptericola halotolerans]